jgi:hypothetical protein
VKTNYSRVPRLVFTAIVLGIVVFLAMQFVRPAIGNPPTTAELAAPPEVRRVLKNSCYNCHSNETQLSWFDQVAPAYWIAARDVKMARSKLNFSEIGNLPPAKQKGLMWETVNQAQLGGMPLPSYLAMHHDARVSDADLAVLKSYLHSIQPVSAPDEKATDAADKQYDQWIHASTQALNVQTSSNGIAYIPDYKNWKVVSTTDRVDNNTMRIIFGNDVAVRAIAEHHINPWPDGATFAKAAWQKQVDKDGTTHAGAFLQVEFMIKDSQKYSGSTKGWGYARWVGMDLKPYGKDAGFTGECVGCHNPVKNNDYVYTFPLEGQQ